MNNIKDKPMENNLTKEERMIFDMLSAKIGHVPIIELSNKKKNKKEIEQEVIENAIKCRALRAVKKNQGR